MNRKTIKKVIVYLITLLSAGLVYLTIKTGQDIFIIVMAVFYTVVGTYLILNDLKE